MRVLVPLDGSAASAHALSYALRLADQHPGSLVILLNIQNAETLDLSDTMPGVVGGPAVGAEASADVLKEPIVRCQAVQTRFKARAEYGPVAETIDRVARETQADQIVMGTRGLGRVRGLLLGSVATQVVHLSDIPVTLVKEEKLAIKALSGSLDWSVAPRVA